MRTLLMLSSINRVLLLSPLCMSPVPLTAPVTPCAKGGLSGDPSVLAAASGGLRHVCRHRALTAALTSADAAVISASAPALSFVSMSVNAAVIASRRVRHRSVIEQAALVISPRLSLRLQTLLSLRRPSIP